MEVIMVTYSNAFEKAVDHAMLYEVGMFWNLNAPGARDGLVDTKEHRRACGYVNDPDDKGGETKYGIAKNANSSIDITHLNWDGAKAIYYSHYWLNAKCDKMPGRIAALQFDGSVNHGPGTASKFIQRAIGVVDDGAIGPKTLTALETKNEIELCNSVCDQRETYYRNIVSNNPTQQKYLAGWLRRVTEMRDFVTNKTVQF
jgi:lysozyme family protein